VIHWQQVARLRELEPTGLLNLDAAQIPTIGVSGRGNCLGPRYFRAAAATVRAR
jgi:hypothetical protein